MLKRTTLLFSALALPLALGGCLDGDDPNFAPPVAELRVVHGSPDAPAVDVLVDDNAAISGAAYLAGTGYLPVPSEGFKLDINAAGTSTTALSLDPVELAPETRYTAIAANTLDSLEVLVLDDSNEGAATGNGLLRLVHGAPGAPAVDIYASAPGGTLSPLATNVSFKDYTEFLSVPAGSYAVTVTATGSMDPLYVSQPIALGEGDVFTAVALENPEPTVAPILVGAYVDDSTFATVTDSRGAIRAAHLSPDAPNVDILVDDAVVLTNVPFKAVSDYLVVDAGTRNVKVNVTGTTTTVIDQDVEVAASETITVAAVNFVASIEPLASSDDLAPPAAGEAKLRVVHASPDAPNVDVLVDGTEVLTDVPFKAISDYLTVGAGDVNVQVNVTGTTTTVIDVTPTLVDGGIYTAIAANEVASIEAVLVQDN
ncbi:MAG: DUF4397 domain-containing protein [Gammaproteobacteria bacterium]|nr:DUF4397 domain-containing protein [Gammaproteobacteria bacterium]